MKFNINSLTQRIINCKSIIDDDYILPTNETTQNAAYAIGLLNVADVLQPSLIFNSEGSIEFVWDLPHVHICIDIENDTFTYYEKIKTKSEGFDDRNINYLSQHIENIKHHIQYVVTT